MKHAGKFLVVSAIIGFAAAFAQPVLAGEKKPEWAEGLSKDDKKVKIEADKKAKQAEKEARKAKEEAEKKARAAEKKAKKSAEEAKKKAQEAARKAENETKKNQ